MSRIRTTAAWAAAAVFAVSLVGCSPAASDSGGSFDPDEKVSLDFAWWGNDDRAARYATLIEAFNEEHPNITIKTTFTDFPSYWEQRQVEAASGSLPDVFQFSDSYLRQYGESGAILDLDEVADQIDFTTFDDSLLGTGRLDGTQYSLPTGYSLWANFVNEDLLKEHGLELPAAGSSFDEFNDWLAEVTDKTGGDPFGGTDYTQRIQVLELQLRAAGKALYTEEGELGFTKDELADFWESGATLRDGITIPQQQLEEISPISGFGSTRTLSEMSWSNFLGGYLADSGASSIGIVAPPTTDAGAKDLYRQGGLQVAISSRTKHPEAAAIFLDYVVNSPEAGEIFGTTLGFPASSSKLEGTKLEGPDQQVADYIESVSDRIGDAPPPAVVGYGSLEQKFWDLGKELGLGTKTVDAAVDEFFAEADVILNN
ncbi:carbohydrate ABC transporter substrate-binding protein, CUT1 family [Microbacterium sp. LKL04]|uniref:Carbohydrate ABC transporter substrate-binding protein n=1 Tax=Microbacterium oleivorans TaxID=273677 RepID=A0A4R5YGK9_9MICO|nr:MULTISPECIES: ABC transporter substrate-binding protein [Microbacterium]TDL43439.1 carbohydrate ABC transporter substrate-binding protein [Microbacterium oleivorans]SCY17987.1 carbohydrate ABC transporter substrate-binding protein, CUT1 family [Microbacterium sp. LKL04]